MIFVTVGTQLPFDRLIKTVDDWAVAENVDDVVAQVGHTAFVPRRIRVTPFMEANELHEHANRADLIVAHAGMGSILTALSLGKPIIVMPRSAELHEHRNAHQEATARQLKNHPGVNVAADETELRHLLSTFDRNATSQRIPRFARYNLLETIREAIAVPAERTEQEFSADFIPFSEATPVLPERLREAVDPGRFVREISRPDESPADKPTFAAAVLIGGGLHASPLAERCGRSPLEMPSSDTGNILDVWSSVLDGVLGEDDSHDEIPKRWLLQRSEDPPLRMSAKAARAFRVVADRAILRGPGGALRDAVDPFEDDQLVLALEASCVPHQSLADAIAGASIDPERPATVIRGQGTQGITLLVLRVDAIRRLPAAGYVDLKEQSLAKLCRGGPPGFTVVDRLGSSRITDRAGYVQLLRELATTSLPSWQPGFALVEKGAYVSPEAAFFDSVALDGARVAAGSTVIRSIVTAGAAVRPGESFTDAVVTSSRNFRLDLRLSRKTSRMMK